MPGAVFITRRPPRKRAVADLSARLAVLGGMTPAELRLEWGSIARESCPNVAPQLLCLMVAHRLQVVALGGLSRRQARQLATNSSVATGLKSGTRLFRSWQARSIIVTVVEGGYLYEGTTYPSLTRIAKVVTGTHWSGPRFFGLKDAA